jgi:hypothetical protein
MGSVISESLKDSMAQTCIKHETASRSHVKCALTKLSATTDGKAENGADQPVPVRNDAACQATLELAMALETEKEQRELEKAMGLLSSCCQAIGELTFAHAICRPDIAVPVIKSSQHASCEAQSWVLVNHVFCRLSPNSA